MRRAALLLAATLCVAPWIVSPARAATYVPPPGKAFAGLTGGFAIAPFESLVRRHPPVFEKVMRWNTSTDWLAVRGWAFTTRLGVALTTAVGKDKRAVISSEGIARGRSDRFLVSMNQNIARSGRIVYVRIMGEMNGWWNPYCPYNRNGSFRGRAFSPRYFIEAWRRTVLILRGGPVRTINHRLHALGMPPIRARTAKRAVLPRPKVAFMWVPQTRGDPQVRRNLPGVYWPGRNYVDWVGTDFFSPWHNWRWLTPFYNHYIGKPFVLAEWGVLHRDDPKFVRDLFSWVGKHRRVRMLNYYQGYSNADPYNPAHYPKSMAMLRRELASPKFPQYAREYQPKNAWINRKLGEMTLREKVGQLFEVNGYGQSVRDHDPAMVTLNQQYYGVDNVAQLIQSYHVGGITYFDWANNLENPSQVAGLSNGIQQVALHSNSHVPMLISTDREQGEVLGVGAPATVFPGNMALGATRDAGLAQRVANIAGVELRAMGINVDNAPVLDVNVQPLNQADGITAYGDRMGLVLGFGVAQVKGYQTRQATTGVGATAKHWPGFGDAKINSATGIARSPQTLAQVNRTNVPSFRAAMRAGIDRIMVAHILFPRITGTKTPASLSQFWVNGFLRGKLHFNGPVVTDALDAAALKGFTPAQVALKALHAGDDQLLEVAQTGVDTTPADLVPAYNAVLHAVRTGAVSKYRLDQSLRRILALKWKLGLAAHPFTDPNRASKVVGTPAHLAVAKTAAKRSITVIKNSAHVLPLASDSGKKVLVTGFGNTTTSTLGTDIAAQGLNPTVMETGFDPDSATISSTVAAAQQNDLVVVSTFNAWSASGQVELVNALLKTGKPVIVAAVGSPYGIAYFPRVTTFLATYDPQPVSLRPLVRVMFGHLKSMGKLPVTIRKPPPSKRVLYPFGYGLQLP